MTDAEISYQLALAIGWPKKRVLQVGDAALCHVDDPVIAEQAWRYFDYAEPRVIWPIAEKYNAFPCELDSGGWTACASPYYWGGDEWAEADTAAKAVALAVIGSKE